MKVSRWMVFHATCYKQAFPLFDFQSWVDRAAFPGATIHVMLHHRMTPGKSHMCREHSRDWRGCSVLARDGQGGSTICTHPATGMHQGRSGGLAKSMYCMCSRVQQNVQATDICAFWKGRTGEEEA